MPPANMSGDVSPGPPTLVKVGSGSYLEWSGEDLSGLSAGRLLKALKHDELFEGAFRGVVLKDCKVFVLWNIAGIAPSPDEEGNAKPLEGFAAVRSVAGESPTNLAIRVELPAPPAGESGAGAGAGRAAAAGRARRISGYCAQTRSLTFAPFPRALLCRRSSLAYRTR